MSLLTIAWRNFCHRSLSSFLTTLSLALGVGLVVTVLSVYGIIREAFERNAAVGYNLVVGPKGSALQLTLNSVYYLSQPIENLPYTEYMEFLPMAKRAELVQKFGGDPALAERDGKYAVYIGDGFAIPLALGDFLGEFRLVGTVPEFFEKLRHGPNVDQEFTFREGRALQENSKEHGFFEAVLGNRVADEMRLGVGDVINPKHGNPDGKDHAEGFTVVGIMNPTGTPNDRAAFVNLEGFYLMEGHAKPVDAETEEALRQQWSGSESASGDGATPLSIPAREVTSILIKNGNVMFAPAMQNLIQEDVRAQAAAPVGEIRKLMATVVGPLSGALLVITLITCVVAAVGVLVAIYNSMNDRKRDIAVMRALGARRETVTAIILAESLLIAFIGGITGWLIAHAGLYSQAARIEDQTGVSVGPLTMSSYEIYVLPLVVALALLAGIIPALTAYRTDVAQNLSA
ncbi:MAG: FtsX-like permease family protein [Planctomycetota bacterium]